MVPYKERLLGDIGVDAFVVCGILVYLVSIVEGKLKVITLVAMTS